MTADYNPVRIETAIRQCANSIAKSVSVCGEAYAGYLDADREYDAAYARAYLNATGPVHARKYTAELATQTERARRDVADATYQVANRRARALEAELRALQSVGASIRQAFEVAGRGA